MMAVQAAGCSNPLMEGTTGQKSRATKDSRTESSARYASRYPGRIRIGSGPWWKLPMEACSVGITKDIPYQVCGAQQDNTTVCVQSAAGGRRFGVGSNMFAPLYAVGGGESGYIAPDPKDPNMFYAGSQGALLTRFDRRSGETRDVQVYPLFFSGMPASSLKER